jgi:TetR/AcrR family transcriptional regulator, regulator of autoinduction and epiphytic fitness
MENNKKPENGIEIRVDKDREISIGQLVESVTKLTGMRCTTAMIYNYEKQGLISPPGRTEGGFRLFRIEDIQLVACIKQWQAQGMSLSVIKEKLDECSDEFSTDTFIPHLPADPRRRILEAAGMVFPQKGYASTTLQDVAQKAGLSSSAIYQHFASKEELFLALTDNLDFSETLNQINDALDTQNELSVKDVRHALIVVAEAFSDTHTRNAEIVRLFISEARQFPEVGERYCLRLIAPVEDSLEHYLTNQMQRGVLKKVEVKLAVHAFYGIFLNFVITQQLLRGEGILLFPKKDRISQLVDIYLQGMLAEPDRPR